MDLRIKKQFVAPLLLIGFSSPVLASFTSAVDLSNWTFIKELNSSNAYVDLGQAPNEFTLYGSNSGTGRASNDIFSISIPTPSLSTFKYTGESSVHGDVGVNYTATLETVNISFDWSYKTNDIDGPSFDKLICSPSCTGFNNNGPSIQSGQVNFNISDYIMSSSYNYYGYNKSFTPIIDPLTGYTFYLPSLLNTQISGNQLISAEIASVDSSYGGAQVTWSNFSITTSFQNVSGQLLIPAPLPTSIWLFGSAFTGFIGFNRRKIAAISS